jgi:ribosomal protein S14
MNNKCLKDKKKRLLIIKYEKKKLLYKYMLIHKLMLDQKKEQFLGKLINLPKNCSEVKIRNRCTLTGRSRGIIKHFKLSRLILRELILDGKLPGVKKSSW